MYSHKDLKRIFNMSNSELNVVRQNIFSETYFYANICQVCQRHNREVPFVTCGNCRMVSYCSRKHQIEHWPSHADFCAIISDFPAYWNSQKFLNEKSRWNDEKRLEWNNYVIEWAEFNLKRKLLPYEKQMILYPKVCEVCNQVDYEENKLISCKNCPQANFCTFHYGFPKHEDVCHLFTSSCTLDAYTTLFEDQLFLRKIGILPYESLDQLYLSKSDSQPHQCQKFTKFPREIHDYLELVCKMLKNGSHNYELASYLSDFASYPLTFLHVLKKWKIPFTDTLSVHVIGATTEMEFPDVWELVFHLLPQLSSLHLTFIGPECDVSSFSSSVCDVCTLQCKKIFFETFDSHYKEYCEGDCFKEPDLVLGYNIEIGTSDTWKKSLHNINCPFFLTASSKTAANLQHAQIQKFFDSNYHSLRFNPFRSNRPSRNYIRNKPSFINSFITIYRGLAMKNDGIDSKESCKAQDAAFKDDLRKSQELKFLPEIAQTVEQIYTKLP